MGFKVGLFILGILWATLIGDEPKGLGQGQGKNTSKVDPPSKSMAMDTWRKDEIRLKELSGIDRQRFLLSFERQSQGELKPCLQRWQPSPFSLPIKAILDKEGRLTHILGPDHHIPNCALEAMETMNFRTISSSLKGASISIYWRVDW